MENIKETASEQPIDGNEKSVLEEVKEQLENETDCEKPQQLQPRMISLDEVLEDEDDDDDDEEKDISQKLIIDLPEEEEEEEEEDEQEEIITTEETKTTQEVPGDKSASKPVVDVIITLSDGEEDTAPPEVALKPGKVQKRRSAGAATATGNEEEHYRLKRRKINVAGAPKMPLTGYVRYMNDRRELLRKEHPTKTAMEHTKIIGEEWQAMSVELKSPYLKAADVDKQRYVKELNSFLKARPDILASELAKNKTKNKTTPENSSPSLVAATSSSAASTSATAATKSALGKEKPTYDVPKTSKDQTKEKQIKDASMVLPSTSQQAQDKSNFKRKRTPTPPSTATNTNASTSTSTSTFVTPAPGEIPIFTNEFLEHNKLYDMELRTLRKSKTDIEQQNSVLEKHVENMKFGVEKMMSENNELQEKNRLLEVYLDKLKRKLAQALGTLPLPSAPNGATVDNIDKYMQDLYKMSTSNSHGPATLNKAKDIIRKLDLQIQL